MKVKHINSGEVIDLTNPNYGKHYYSIYGYLVLTNESILFFHSFDGEIQIEDVTDKYEIIYDSNVFKGDLSGWSCHLPDMSSLMNFNLNKEHLSVLKKITFDGGHGREGIIWAEKTECTSCKEEKDCIIMDGSEEEYGAGAICLDCAKELLAHSGL